MEKTQKPLISGKYHRDLGRLHFSAEVGVALEKYKKLAAERLDARYIAFIDETYQEPSTTAGGFYAFSVCVVDAQHVSPVRAAFMKRLYKDLSASKESGTNPDYPAVRYHFTEANGSKKPARPWYTSENNAKVYRTIGALQDNMRHYVFVSYLAPESNKTKRSQVVEQSRAQVLASTLMYLNRHEDHPVDVAVLESRSRSKSPTQDALDDKVIEDLKRADLLPSSFGHIHTTATIEPLLIISDGTGWAYRRLQLKGEASHLKNAHIQQTVIDAHSLTSLSYELPRHAVPIATRPNWQISPAQKNHDSLDYYMLGYIQTNNLQTDPTMRNAHAVIGATQVN